MIKSASSPSTQFSVYKLLKSLSKLDINCDQILKNIEDAGKFKHIQKKVYRYQQLYKIIIMLCVIDLVVSPQK